MEEVKSNHSEDRDSRVDSDKQNSDNPRKRSRDSSIESVKAPSLDTKDERRKVLTKKRRRNDSGQSSVSSSSSRRGSTMPTNIVQQVHDISGAVIPRVYKMPYFP